MKLIKWAKKNGAAKIAIGGVEIEFVTVSPIPAPSYTKRQVEDVISPETQMKVEAMMGKIRGDLDAGVEAHRPSDESTKKAMAALRSTMDDPDVFAHKSDEWANQTRLPR